MNIRLIQKEDNLGLAKVIREVLTEYGVNKPGTVFTDPTTDALFELFQMKDSAYFVVELNGEILGGCGVYPTKGLPKGCVELVKIYLHHSLRGQGVGKQLMQLSIDVARARGFISIYLETMPELSNAIGLYEMMGFQKLNSSLGDSGHFACDLWMLKQL
ncbi:MAG TPA: GNAT family N-acetyltransferase [Crocinitomicaceae bacterium]|nr:GNAT family N-acetyltransferase [Crocinitomicaceae bacterium]